MKSKIRLTNTKHSSAQMRDKNKNNSSAKARMLLDSKVFHNQSTLLPKTINNPLLFPRKRPSLHCTKK